MEFIHFFPFATEGSNFSPWRLKLSLTLPSIFKGPKPYKVDHWADRGSFRNTACRHGF